MVKRVFRVLVKSSVQREDLVQLGWTNFLDNGPLGVKCKDLYKQDESSTIKNNRIQVHLTSRKLLNALSRIAKKSRTPLE